MVSAKRFMTSNMRPLPPSGRMIMYETISAQGTTQN